MPKDAAAGAAAGHGGPGRPGVAGTAPPSCVVATAGHVDHGKSTLVAWLTGTDPDRLDEERRRGLTIDLGFASTELPSGREVAFVQIAGLVARRIVCDRFMPRASAASVCPRSTERMPARKISVHPWPGYCRCQRQRLWPLMQLCGEMCDDS